MKMERIIPNGNADTSKIINACCVASKEYIDYNNNFNKFYKVDDSMLFAVNCNSHVAHRFVTRSDYASSSNLNKEYIVETVMEMLTSDEDLFWEVTGYKTVWLVKKYKHTYDAFCIELKPHSCGGINVNTIYIKTYIQKVNCHYLAVEKEEPIFVQDTVTNEIIFNPVEIRKEK